MTRIRFYNQVDDRKLRFAVIVTKASGHWVFCKHRERNTLEIPGGHREPGEDILTTAKRELYEETGAVDFTLEPVCVYSVTASRNDDGQETFGMLFYAEVAAFEKELHSEIERIVVQDELPTAWTYPEIQPYLMQEVVKRQTGIRLLTGEQRTVQNSLVRFDNHDPRIPYFELMLEQSLDDISEAPLPAGYHYQNYTPGDKVTWITIEKSAKEFNTREEGETAWERYYAGHESELENRMFFVVDDSGQKLATATAFYDIRTGDDGRTGWLHWVAVRRDSQGRGLSKPLITHVLQHMKKLGYTRSVVPTQTTTWLACKIYLDLGFRPIPENAERNETGWRIVRTLTDHPALSGFAPVSRIIDQPVSVSGEKTIL